METLIELLTNARVLSVLTPTGLVAGILGYIIYKLFQKYDALQELRIAEWKAMRDEYTNLCKEINSTLDAVLKVIGKK
jgi:hypothetical protein